MNKLRNLLGKILFKKRHVFVGRFADWKQTKQTHPDFEVWQVHDLSEEQLSEIHWSFLETSISGFLIDRLPHILTGKVRLKERLKADECVAFLAVEKETHTPVGYVWGFIPAKDTVALGLPIPAGSFFRFDAYTAKPYRRQGVTTLVRSAAAKWANTQGCERYMAHIDAGNRLAFKADPDDFNSTHRGDNYLFRAGGYPMLSATTWFDTPGITINYLPRENQFY